MNRRHRAAAVVLLAVVLTATACAGSDQASSSSSPETTPSASTELSGPVDVLYAGSLVNTMEHQLGPAFDRATGASFQGFPAGSTELTNQIKGGVRRADVFISASPGADTALEGAPNGDWVSWHATFGKSPLVIGYNPHSSFAGDFGTKPWYQVLTLPGIQLGRTDPQLDPKGQLTAKALGEAASQYNLSGFATAVESKAVVFPEETLVGRLQSGQLDAGFFYSLEAVPLHIPTVGLGRVHAAATYTVTVPNHAPHPAAAAAFVTYLLSPAGRKILHADGMTLVGPTLSGSAKAVPRSVVAVVRG